MIDKKELTIRYIEAMQEQDNRNNEFENAMSIVLNGYAVYEPITYNLYKVYDDILIKLFGEENFNWIMWYLYDRPDTDQRVVVDNIEHIIDSPQKLVDFCMVW